jgi:hypothetical protein
MAGRSLSAVTDKIINAEHFYLCNIIECLWSCTVMKPLQLLALLYSAGCTEDPAGPGLSLVTHAVMSRQFHILMNIFHLNGLAQ